MFFFGESMFHKETDASKAAFTALAKLCVDYGVEVIDCQVYNPHLESLGATLMSRQDFEKALRDAIKATYGIDFKQPTLLTAHHPHGA